MEEDDRDFKPVAKKRKKSVKASPKSAAKKHSVWMTMLPVDIMMNVAENLPPDALFSLSFSCKVTFESFN